MTENARLRALNHEYNINTRTCNDKKSMPLPCLAFHDLLCRVVRKHTVNVICIYLISMCVYMQPYTYMECVYAILPLHIHTYTQCEKSIYEVRHQSSMSCCNF